jgi:hypothetical protein
MDAVAGSNLRIARRANAQARADFATWQMMVKLKSEATLSADAQSVLADYNSLKAKGSADADAVEQTIQALYRRYYSSMGGTGQPPVSDALQPKLAASKPPQDDSARGQGNPDDGQRDNVTQFRPRPKNASKNSSQTGSRFGGSFGKGGDPRKIPAWLIFILLVCVVALVKLLLG